MPITWFRWYYAVGLVLCATALAAAFMLEYREGVMPCVLCQLQRLMFLGVALGFLFTLARRRLTRSRLRWTALLNTLFVAFGLYFALRQLWLIHIPQAEPGVCGAGIIYIFNHLPLGDALKATLLGTGDCAIVSWRHWGITLPGWSTIIFTAALLLSWLPLLCSRRRYKIDSSDAKL